MFEVDVQKTKNFFEDLIL